MTTEKAVQEQTCALKLARALLERCYKRMAVVVDVGSCVGGEGSLLFLSRYILG